MAARCTGVVKALGTQQGKRRTQKPFGRLALHGLHVDPEHDLDLGEAAVGRGGARRCQSDASQSQVLESPQSLPAEIQGCSEPVYFSTSLNYLI